MMRFLFFLATVSWLASGLSIAVLAAGPASASGPALILTALGATIAFCAAAIIRAIRPSAPVAQE